MPSQIDMYKDKILKILKKHEVKRASLFGSIIRGEMSDQSDIDLLIEFEGEKSLLDLAALKIELEDKLQCKVDVLTYNSLHPLLRDRILTEQVEIL
jgi:predicted nucleotidyltransferase